MFNLSWHKADIPVLLFRGLLLPLLGGSCRRSVKADKDFGSLGLEFARIQHAALMVVLNAGTALVLLWPVHCAASDPAPELGPNAKQLTLAVSAERPSQLAFTVFGGYSSSSAFTSILFRPWTVKFEDAQLLAGAFSKRIKDLGANFTIDWEAGAGKRFGNSNAGEFWSAFYLRFDGFPWQETVYITAGLSTGLNYATNISDLEVKKSGNRKGSKLLHYLAPEITFARPSNKNTEIVVRLHHRSGIFGIFSGTKGGSNFLALGLRQHF